MNKFHITNYKIYDSRVKVDFRVLIISDVHFNFYTKEKTLDLILKKIIKLSPNYIFLPGDFLDCNDIFYNEDKFPIAKNWLESIGKIAPIFIGLGNHECYATDSFNRNSDDFISEYNKRLNKINNVYVLDNTTFIDDKISITGLTLSREYYGITDEKKKATKEDKDILIKELVGLNKTVKYDFNKINFIMAHSPIYLTDEDVPLEKYDYVLSGHMHNGCVPPILYEIWNSNRGIVSPDKRFFAKNTRNTLKEKDDKLLVNGPIITFSKHILPLNLLNKLFPMYLSIMDFTNDKTYDKKNIYIKRYYEK